MTREELQLQIREFVKKVREHRNSNLSYDELNEMYSLHNQYFQLWDQPGCGSCNAQVWERLINV